MKNGLLTKPTRGQIIRLAPPLTIQECEIIKAGEIIKDTVMAMKRRLKGNADCARNSCCQVQRCSNKAILRAVAESEQCTNRFNNKKSKSKKECRFKECRSNECKNKDCKHKESKTKDCKTPKCAANNYF